MALRNSSPEAKQQRTSMNADREEQRQRTWAQALAAENAKKAATDANMVRLKKLRLAKEAADAETASLAKAAAPPAKPVRKAAAKTTAKTATKTTAKAAASEDAIGD